MGQRCVGSGRAIWARAGRRTSLTVIVALGLAGLMNLPWSPFGQTPTGQAWAQTLPREYDATRVQTVVNELERRIRNLEGRGWQIVQSESEPGGSGPLVWVKNSTQRAFVRLAGRWFELYASTQSGSGSGGTPVWPISPEWIGEGTISWDELAELNSDSLGGILLRQFIQNKADTNWVQGQISGNLDLSPLGSWSDWAQHQRVNGFWLTVQHWTDSSYWYLAPDTTAMWLSDTLFAGADTVLYAEFEAAVRDVRGHLDVAAYSFTATDTVIFAHNLGTRQVAIQVWQNDSTETWPNEAAWVDDNTVRAVFLSDLSGKMLVMGLRQ